MPGSSLTIEQILTILTETPPRIDALTAGLAPAQLHAPPIEDEWSLNDVLAHLRACGDVWGNYIMMILDQEGPTIRAVSPRTWIKQTDYPQLEFAPLLHSFTSQRAIC